MEFCSCCPGASNSSASAFQVAGITGARHHAQLGWFCIFSRDGVGHVGQAGLKLLSSSDPPTWTSQSAGMTGMSHRAQPSLIFSKINTIFLANLVSKHCKALHLILRYYVFGEEGPKSIVSELGTMPSFLTPGCEVYLYMRARDVYVILISADGCSDSSSLCIPARTVALISKENTK